MMLWFVICDHSLKIIVIVLYLFSFCQFLVVEAFSVSRSSALKTSGYVRYSILTLLSAGVFVSKRCAHTRVSTIWKVWFNYSTYASSNPFFPLSDFPCTGHTWCPKRWAGFAFVAIGIIKDQGASKWHYDLWYLTIYFYVESPLFLFVPALHDNVWYFFLQTPYNTINNCRLQSTPESWWETRQAST